MSSSLRTKKVARMLQKALGEVLIRLHCEVGTTTLVTVTMVHVSADLGLAKVYLSFMLHENREAMLAKVEQQKGMIRKLLGNRVGHKLPKVPALQFYIDDSALHAVKIHRLLGQLDIPEGP